MYRYNIFFYSISFFLFSCTSNPFWEDPKTIDRTLKGTISLVNSNYSHPILLWDNYSEEISETDSAGNFLLNLSSIYNQTNLGSGELKLYFFALNYYIDSASVYLVEGLFSDNQTDFDREGNLIKDISLRKKVDGEIIFNNELLSEDTLDLKFVFEIFEPLVIKSYVYLDPNIECASGLFFYNIDNEEVTIYRHSTISDEGILVQDQFKYNDYEVNDTHLWNYIVAMDKVNLNAGRYIMKPYFLILDNSPKNTSDLYSLEFDKNYLNIPSDIKSDTLYIE